MNVLLTGGTGFLGGHLAKALREDGHEVALVVRKGSSPKLPISLDDYRCYSLDEATSGAPFSEMALDAVVHCATVYGRVNAVLPDLVECNLLFPLKLLVLAREKGVGCFVNSDTFFCSQIADGREDVYLPGYTLSKWQFAQWAKLVCATGETTFCNMQLHHVYGEYDSEDKFIPWVIRQCAAGEAEIGLRNPDCHRDFVYVDDVVGAYLTVLGSFGTLGCGFREFEVGLGEAQSVESFVKMIAGVVHPATRVVRTAGECPPIEPDFAQADPAALMTLGWNPRFTDHRANIRRMLRENAY